MRERLNSVKSAAETILRQCCAPIGATPTLLVWAAGRLKPQSWRRRSGGDLTTSLRRPRDPGSAEVPRGAAT